MTNKLPEKNTVFEFAMPLIKEYEGLCLSAYECPAGFLSVGYGHNIQNLPPAEKSNFLSITEQQANDLLFSDMSSFYDRINEMVIVPLNKYQAAAILCFTFNLGAENLRRSTLLQRLNAGEYIEAAQEFLRWVKARDKKGERRALRGLIKRRNAEYELFLKGI